MDDDVALPRLAGQARALDADRLAVFRLQDGKIPPNRSMLYRMGISFTSSWPQSF
ncbi:MAG: hypothetical protein ACLVL7_09575 [Anaerotruncus massiliensis (ex Togo et al. 2019)]